MKKRFTKKQITYWLSVAVVGIALGLGLQFVRAWTEPTAAPPNGNVGAPINTGAQTQTKAGSLITGGAITAYGRICSNVGGWHCLNDASPPCYCTIDMSGNGIDGGIVIHKYCPWGYAGQVAYLSIHNGDGIGGGGSIAVPCY